MAQSSIGCPDAETLASHARNDLSSHDTAVLDEHLTACRTCLDRYVEFSKHSPVGEIPGCHIVKEMGRGRFGIVYKAWWLKGRPRIVALKILSSPGQMESSRFEREIAVLKKIDSPWIVKCLESGLTDDARYYVMDFVEGEHLDSYLAKNAENLNDKLAVFERVCRAVADAHDRGVVHRDLKPRNILIDREGEPHILDFGICTLAEEDWSSGVRHTITHPGDVIGTLKYMSPEQAWGGVAGEVDFRSDLWALGVMLYEIVTGGDHPYSLQSTRDKSVQEAILERLRKELPRRPRLESLPRGRDLEILLERCLVWEPRHRLSSAAKLADDLDRYRRAQRIRTTPLSLGHRVQRLAVGAATRSRWTFGVSFVATLGLMLWPIAWFFDVGWLVTGRCYQGLEGSPAVVECSDGPSDPVLIVGVFDDTVDAVSGFAVAGGITGVTKDIRSWRGVHGHLMERLARAGPKAVVWDYYFRTPQPGDAQLVAGIRTLEEKRIPVVLASKGYRMDGAPDISPSIVQTLGADLRHGAIVARDMVRRPGEFVIAINSGDDSILPGLALTTLAAVLHPNTRSHVEWSAQNKWIELIYEIEPGAFLRERDRIEFTKTFKADRGPEAFGSDDAFACTTFPLEDPEYWERRTVAYHVLLLNSDEELRALVADKVVIIGELRRARPGVAEDRHAVKYGATIIRDVPGCYLLGDAIAGLLKGRYFRSVLPLSLRTFIIMLLAAAVGCLLPIRLATLKVFERRSGHRGLWVMLLGLSALSLIVMVVSHNRLTLHMGMVGFSVLTPMAGAFWVEFARNRHRILETHRRAIVDVAPALDGTVTLAPTQLKSPRAEE